MLLLAGANPSLTSTTTGPEGPLDPAGVARMRGFPKMAHLLARFGHETRNSEFQSSRTKTLGPKASRKCNSGLKAGQRGHHQRGCTFLHYHHVGHESGAAKLDLLGQVLREAGQCKSICIYVNHTSTIHKLLPYLESTFGEHSPQSGIGKWAIISSEAGFRASNTMQRWVSRDMDKPHMLVTTDMSVSDASTRSMADYKICINFDLPDGDVISTYRARALMDHKHVGHLTCVTFSSPQQARQLTRLKTNLEGDGQVMEELPRDLRTDILNRCAVGESPFR
eukprot:TRINITY_DN13550_c0_g1_i9.p1 TRINITY_DN13550_c0_g1~~TRINITY_DN13550_c0_g1_i9.p1  ORF type:complete len:280 (-),score=58.68 TRINITY_DN13550_c0_g1_i9:413-1252(-)